jgi:hypothetical protein
MKFALRDAMPAVEREIAATPDAVWRVLIDLDAWPVWGPSVQGAELDEPGSLRLNARGHVRTPVGVSLPFTITEYEDRRYWAWRVAGIPATKHGVEPAPDGCVAWMSAPVWAPAYLPVLAIALERIANMAT